MITTVPSEQILEPQRLAAVHGSRLLDSAPDEPFDRLATLARDLLETPYAFVTVVDDRRSFWKSCVGVDLAPGSLPQNPVEESFCQYVVADGKPVVLDDVRRDARTMHNPSIELVGVAAWAGYPVHSPDGQVLGTLCVMDVVPRSWTARDRQVLDTLSQAASSEVALRVAVDDARRSALEATAIAQRSDQVALVLQRSLLTQPSVPAHLDVAVRYQPATELAQVGGDWYDAFTQPDGSTMLVIGDVCGHDVAAAAAMGQLRSLVRGSTYDRADPPSQVLTHVDRAIRGLEADTLATVVLARLAPPSSADERGLLLRWSNAGHPPPLLLCADGRAQILSSANELLLGVDPQTERTDHERLLLPGDTLLLYTDGLIERPEQTIQDGLEQLSALLSGLATASLDALCKAVLDGAPSGAPSGIVRDDVALVAVRNRGYSAA